MTRPRTSSSGATLSIDLGGETVSLDLRHWVDSGLISSSPS
jgi:hypothetical protein